MEYDINAIDDIDLRHKHWHKLRNKRVEILPNFLPDARISMDLITILNVTMKPSGNTIFENYKLLHGTLPCYKNAINGRFRSARQIILVDLGEFNLFQFAQTCLRPAESFVLGFIEDDTLSEYEMRATYEQSASYNALKGELSVEICIPRLESERMAFFKDTYSYLNDILDPMVKIIVIQTPPGIFQRENFINERGRRVKSVSPQNLDERTAFIEDLLIF